MYLIPIAWMYVALMMAIAEATSSQGTVLGACFTFLLYGVLPLSIVMYLMRTPGRRRARRALEQAAAAVDDGEPAAPPRESGAGDPDRGGHAAGDAVAPERKEP